MQLNTIFRYGIFIVLAVAVYGKFSDNHMDAFRAEVQRTREKSGFEYKMVRPNYKPPFRELEIEKELASDDLKKGDAKKDLADGKKKDAKKTDKKNAKNDKKKKDQKTAKATDANKNNHAKNPSSPDQRSGFGPNFNSGGANYGGGYYANNDLKTSTGLSASQWRLALLSSPNLANFTKFVNEYNSGNVDEKDFYSICEELLRDSRTEAQLYTVQILGTLEHPKAFDLIVRFQGKLSSVAESLILTVFDSYKNLSKAPFISSVLRSDFEKTTLTKAAEIAYIISHKASAKGGRAQQLLTVDRTQTASLTSSESKWLAMLVRPLQGLLESSDPELSQSAEIALSQLHLNGIE